MPASPVRGVLRLPPSEYTASLQGDVPLGDQHRILPEHASGTCEDSDPVPLDDGIGDELSALNCPFANRRLWGDAAGLSLGLQDSVYRGDRDRPIAHG
jgi:hypothetical protein